MDTVIQGDDHDTGLARRLHQSGQLDLETLQTCLGEVRARRSQEPGLSLALLLVRRQLVDPDVLGQVIPTGPAPAHAAPQRLGDYRIERVLARGGMGAVYEVVHEPTGVTRALKTLLPGNSVDLAGERDRLRQEALALAQLDHPAIVHVHEADLDAKPPYLVQDLMTGGSLQDRLDQLGPLDPAQAIEVARTLATGLRHAHGRGVLHRDLKPPNVLFDEHGQARLVDFGLALRVDASLRLTASGEVMGTPAYMAPEQATGEGVDERTDVYGLGTVLFAMLTGSPPFLGSNPIKVLSAVLHEQPPRPTDLREDCPAELEQVCLKALAKSPDDRYPSAAALHEALSQLEPECSNRSLPLVGVLALGLAIVALALTLLALAPWESEPELASTAETQEVVPTDTPPAKERVDLRWRVAPGDRLLSSVRTESAQPPMAMQFELAFRVQSVSADSIVFAGRVERAHGWMSVATKRVALDTNLPIEPGDPFSHIREAFGRFADSACDVRLDLRTNRVKIEKLPNLEVSVINYSFDPKPVLAGGFELCAHVLPGEPKAVGETWELKDRFIQPIPQHPFRSHGQHVALRKRDGQRAEIETWFEEPAWPPDVEVSGFSAGSRLTLVDGLPIKASWVVNLDVLRTGPAVSRADEAIVAGRTKVKVRTRFEVRLTRLGRK